MFGCKLWAILAHWYNGSIECFVLHITFLTKGSVAMALNMLNLHCFMVVADKKYFFS